MDISLPSLGVILMSIRLKLMRIHEYTPIENNQKN